MKRWNLRVVLCAVMIAVGLLTSTTSPAPTYAAGCKTGGVIVERSWFNGGYVDLYWSSSCGTNWAVAVSTVNSWYVVEAYILQNYNNTKVVRQEARGYYGTIAETDAVYGRGIPTKACGSIRTESGSVIGGICTNAH